MAHLERQQTAMPLPRVVATPPCVPRLIVTEGRLRSLYAEFLSEPVPERLTELACRLAEAMSIKVSDKADRGS